MTFAAWTVAFHCHFHYRSLAGGAHFDGEGRLRLGFSSVGSLWAKLARRVMGWNWCDWNLRPSP